MGVVYPRSRNRLFVCTDHDYRIMRLHDTQRKGVLVATVSEKKPLRKLPETSPTHFCERGLSVAHASSNKQHSHGDRPWSST